MVEHVDACFRFFLPGYCKSLVFPGSGIDQLQVTQDRERVDYPILIREFEASFVGDI